MSAGMMSAGGGDQGAIKKISKYAIDRDDVDFDLLKREK
jgi:hypothetical protein